MKNNRFARLLALLLSCLFMMGAMCGIVAYADEAAEDDGASAPGTPDEGTDGDVGEDAGEEEVVPPTVNIKYKNLAYEDAVQLIFYVESANVAEGQSVKLILSDEALTEVVIDENTAIYSPLGKLTVGEGDTAVAYDAFASEEIAPTELRVNVYAIAVVVDADNNVLAQSDVLEYNVFQYCMDRIDKNPTADQLALYTALLDFGASVQEIVGYTDETIDEVGGWANAYYGVKVNTVVDENVIATEKHYFTESNIGDTVQLPVDKFYSIGDGVARVSNVSADRKFDAVLAGGILSVTVRGKIGFSSCDVIYAGGGNYTNFENDTKLPSYITSGAFKDDPSAATGIWEGFVSETLEDGSENTFLRISNSAKGSNAVRIGDVAAAAEASKITLELKMRFASVQTGLTSDSGMLLLKFCDSTGKAEISNGKGSSYTIGDFNANSAGTKAGYFEVGQWHDVSFEMIKTEDGTAWDVTMSIDGVNKYSTKVSNPGVTGIRFEPRYKYSVVLDLDDVYLGFE